MLSLLLAKQIASLLLMVLMGYLIVRLGYLTPKDSNVISLITIYIVSPCLFIDMFNVPFSYDRLYALAITGAASIIIIFAYIGFTMLIRKLLKLDAVEQCSVIYPNSANFIIPLVVYTLGQDMVIYTTGFLVIQVFFLWSHCISVIKHKKEYHLRRVLSQINIICVFFGFCLFLTEIKLPEIITLTFHSVASMIGPLSMLITGMLLGGLNLTRLFHYKKFPLVLALRLFVYPAIALIILRFSGLMSIIPNGEKILLVTFLAAAAPCAAMVTQFAQIFKENGEYAGLINVTSTIFCIISIPIMVFFFQL